MERSVGQINPRSCCGFTSSSVTRDLQNSKRWRRRESSRSTSLMHQHQSVWPVCIVHQREKKWRSKRKKDWTDGEGAQYPGHIVSVDQLISPTPGLIAQMTGVLMKAKYKVATVYVDQYSGFGFVHLQKSSGAEETLESKAAFEAISKQHGVSVEGYHADNGVFRSIEWIKDCKKRRQSLTYAGVQAHHTNGKAERRIRYLQDRARAMIIHAQHQWGVEGMVHLWPYAIRLANDAINESANMQDVDNYSPLQIYSGTEVNTNPKHWIPFGCPAYVLTTELQDNKQIFNKWKRRSRIGIYLGRSPMHGRNVALVLNRDSGLVSAQFHVSFDEHFETLGKIKVEHPWLVKAGFARGNKLTTQPGESNTYRKRAAHTNSSEGGARKKMRASATTNQDDDTNRPAPQAVPLQQLINNTKENTKEKESVSHRNVKPSSRPNAGSNDTTPSIEARGEKPTSGNIEDSTDGGSLGTSAQTKGAVAMITIEDVSNDPEGEVEIFAHTTCLSCCG